MKNPYRPPTAVLVDESNRPGPVAPGRLWKAVLIPTAIEFFGTWASMQVTFIGYATYSASLGEEFWETRVRLLSMSAVAGVGLVLPLSRCLMSVLAGYICALVRKRGVWPALVLVSALTSSVSYWTRSLTGIGYYQWYPLSLHLVFSLLCLPALFLGAWLYQRPRGLSLGAKKST